MQSFIDTSRLPASFAAALADYADEMAELLQTPDHRAAEVQPEVEAKVRAMSMVLERSFHREYLMKLDLDVPGVVIDDERYRRTGRTVKQILTLAGVVEVERTVYRERTQSGGASIGALEASLGAIDGWVTPLMAEAMSGQMSRMTPKDVVKSFESMGLPGTSTSTLDRVMKSASTMWERSRVENEQRAQVLCIPSLPRREDVVVLVVSLDGVMVRLKDAPNTPGASRHEDGPHGHKEASSGTIALYDKDGNRLHTIYLARMPEYQKRTLHEQLLGEVTYLVERYPDAQLVSLADGARSNWTILDDIARSVGRTPIRITDFYHAAEHLSDGMKAANQTTETIDKWREKLLTLPNGAALCLAELRRLQTLKSIRSKRKQTCIHEQITYFANNLARMNYSAAEARTLPVGSGVQEAACKTLVVQRMKQSGMSWRHAGGQAVLTFRSLDHSGRSTAAWQVLRRRTRKDVEIDLDRRRQKPKPPTSICYCG